ncbi:hypothetical protein K438DRAFT_1956368 [Mycena galopus ATCC 62051]|nr:hypothetical protein K438DRAFT_1956368 [Mycena galopus ATCC 62051]
MPKSRMRLMRLLHKLSTARPPAVTALKTIPGLRALLFPAVVFSAAPPPPLAARVAPLIPLARTLRQDASHALRTRLPPAAIAPALSLCTRVRLARTGTFLDRSGSSRCSPGTVPASAARPLLPRHSARRLAPAALCVPGAHPAGPT